MENETSKRQKANIDLEIKLPKIEKPFYKKLSTEKNMIVQIKKAGSKLDDYQTLDVWIDGYKNIVLSKEDILTDNLKEKILDRINLLDKLEKAEKSAKSIGIDFGYTSNEKGVKMYNVGGNWLTEEPNFISHVKHEEVKFHKLQADKWALEHSNRTNLSKGMTNSEIDEKQAYHYTLYELKAKELNLPITANIEIEENKQNIQEERKFNFEIRLSNPEDTEKNQWQKTDGKINYPSIKEMTTNLTQYAIGGTNLEIKIDGQQYTLHKETLSSTLEKIEKDLNFNREINKGNEILNSNQNYKSMEQAQQPQSTENKNLTFLKDQIKYLGFGEEPKMLKELETKINSGEKKFDLKVDYDKASFQNKASFLLNFNRSESTGNYFLNTYKANLQNEKRNVNIDHTFAVKQNGFTAKQALNLLEGRSVLATITNPKSKELEPAFIKLKLNEEKNENGNYKLQVFNKNYGVDTAKIVESSKLKFEDDKNKEITIKLLEKGNIVGVKFELDKKVIEGKAILNPQYKTLNLYDQNMKRINTNAPVLSDKTEIDNKPQQSYKQSR